MASAVNPTASFCPSADDAIGELRFATPTCDIKVQVVPAFVDEKNIPSVSTASRLPSAEQEAVAPGIPVTLFELQLVPPLVVTYTGTPSTDTTAASVLPSADMANEPQLLAGTWLVVHSEPELVERYNGPEELAAARQVPSAEEATAVLRSLADCWCASWRHNWLRAAPGGQPQLRQSDDCRRPMKRWKSRN